MNYSLSSYLSKIADFRRSQGLRYPLVPSLLMIIMSILHGAKGYREMARFMRHHEEVLTQLFSLKHGVPSHVSVREILLGIGFTRLNQGFMGWMRQELKQGMDSCLSGDGKALRSTLKHAGNKRQDFVQLVSLFGHQSRLVVAQQEVHHSKAQEAQVIRDLVKALDAKGLIISLDALHCQKKH